MTAVTLGLWFHLKSKVSPVVGFAGHSLGEYAALAASGMAATAETEFQLGVQALAGRNYLMAEANFKRAQDMLQRPGQLPESRAPRQSGEWIGFGLFFPVLGRQQAGPHFPHFPNDDSMPPAVAFTCRR